MPSSSPFVEALSRARPNAGRLGGKGSSLARMVQLGYRVPPGFVVTVDALIEAMQRHGLRVAVDGLSLAIREGEGPGDPGQMVQAFLGHPIPKDVMTPIQALVDELGLWDNNQEGLIVRSSATGEDTAVNSFAGIFESVPISRPDELEGAIRTVWASAFSSRAHSYARARGLEGVPLMAVVVQRFLDAERSGVMFTRFASPDGEDQILVEHVEGGCEKLVKGEVTPDRLWLELGREVPDVLEGELGAPYAQQLSRLAFDLESTFGEPQDIEWVIQGGFLHVVQSRAITSFAPGGRSRPRPSADGAVPLVTGVAASPGWGAGAVHLAFNIEQALALERGRVLVTPMTNPDMVVAMRNSTAIVTDVGGMICHAAIVSRELELPCVVGTERATSTLVDGAVVTVDGSAGVVYAGVQEIARPPAARPMEWKDLWDVWASATKDRSDLVPILPSVAALEAMPPGISMTVLLVPDVDLRTDPSGLWNDLERMGSKRRAEHLERYLRRVAEGATGKELQRLSLLPLGDLPVGDLDAALERLGDARIGRDAPGDGPELVMDPGSSWPHGPAAVPLSAAASVASPAQIAATVVTGGMSEAAEAAVDTIRFFGHQPGSRRGGMPDPASRRRWWDLLPEYGRFHQEHGTEGERGEFEWLEVRPELVISSLLKSLVQPGFEMVPRVMGFPGLPPMHIKWMRCRYHFRADVFARVWEAIVSGTWDGAYMADLMRRVRSSYERLREVLVLFPQTDEELRILDGDRMVALITSWWPRWVEFFALCWFIQAQGDDVAYPFIQETVQANLSRLGEAPGDFDWPPVTDLVAPTTPVMSATYMASVAAVREALLEAGLDTTEKAMAGLVSGRHPGVNSRIERHLSDWGWMRDRDLLFEPWDTPERVIDTALRTEPHGVVSYQQNLHRNVLALGFHYDLAHAYGRATGLNHAARFLHDLNVERENHHILWLKYSYPLRRMFLEIERRLVQAGSLRPGDVFFLQAPELIEAAANLPQPLPADLAARVKNRRLGYLKEARLAPPASPAPVDEDDYY